MEQRRSEVGGMSRRTATWLAWSLCALSLALTALSLLLLALNRSDPNTHIYQYWQVDTLVPVSFSIIGAIIASRACGFGRSLINGCGSFCLLLRITAAA